MKLLENIFLILTITVPSLFLVWGLLKIKKMKKNKKFRRAIILLALSSFLINGIIFGVIKLSNSGSNETEESNPTTANEETPTKDPIEDSKKEESDSNSKDTQKPVTSTKPNEVDTKDEGNPAVGTSEGTTNNGTTNKGFTIEVKNGITYIDGYMVANKTYPLPENYVPENTHKPVGNSHNCQECLINEAYDAYAKMKSDASALGLSLWIASGYRSYTYQNGLYQSYVNRNGKASADTYSARPGHSEHQTGYAFDLNTVSSSFADTKEGKWVNENCSKYGFILRYPKGKESETGYIYEPWHLRYVGTDLSTKLYNTDGSWTTMEDYFGITSQYAQ